MPTYRVYEVQEEIRWTKWMHEVEAETPEEALAVVEEGVENTVCDCGEYGDTDYGRSGYAVRLDGDGSTTNAWDEAAKAMPS